MKNILTLVTGIGILFSPTTTTAQSFDDLLKEGKRIIKEQRERTSYETADFTGAIRVLERANAIKPSDAELHYYLGSAYDYDNSSDAAQMTNTSIPKSIRASREFETVIKLSPKYSGEIIALDPYAKLSSIWGSVGFHYMYRNDHDSAVWAFKEGQKRGAFSKFALDYYRYALTSIEPKAILFTWGDFSMMNMWYLQEVEKVRPDVTLINLSMLGVPWVTSYLHKKDVSLFSSATKANDTTLYVKWKEKKMTIPIGNTNQKFSWTLAPMQMDEYLFRKDLMLIDILTNNKFKRPVYFEPGCPPNEVIGLSDFMKDRVVWYQLTTEQKPGRKDGFVEDLKKFPLAALRTANINSDEEVSKVHALRYEMLAGVHFLYNAGHVDQAKVLYDQIQKNIPLTSFPYEDDQIKGYMEEFDGILK